MTCIVNHNRDRRSNLAKLIGLLPEDTRDLLDCFSFRLWYALIGEQPEDHQHKREQQEHVAFHQFLFDRDEFEKKAISGT